MQGKDGVSGTGNGCTVEIPRAPHKAAILISPQAQLQNFTRHANPTLPQNSRVKIVTTMWSGQCVGARARACRCFAATFAHSRLGLPSHRSFHVFFICLLLVLANRTTHMLPCAFFLPILGRKRKNERTKDFLFPQSKR